MFWRKAKEIAKLQEELRLSVWREDIAENNYNVVCKERDKAAAERDALIKTLRDQDQLIFLMSQCTDWPSMRPHFNKLQEGQESRMRAESDRIRDVLIPEVRKVYEKPKLFGPNGIMEEPSYMGVPVRKVDRLS